MRSSVFAVLAVAAVLSACGQPKADSRGQTAPAQPGTLPAVGAPAATDAVANDPTILAASKTTPEAFVSALYASYGSHAEDAPQIDNRTFYSARTSALFAENQQLHEGYVGYPDADPICDCQDWGDPLRVGSVAVTQIDPTHVSARPTLVNGVGNAPTFHLVKEAGGWRIDDITGLSGGPLVAGLTASNAEGRAHPVAEAIAKPSAQ
ncbi:hypothetical protein BH10PSE2_BH10PSE2_18870 [soil metagenome]